MSIVKIDWFGVTIYGTPVYIDQEGVAWDRACGRCPRCEAETNYKHRVNGSGYFNCHECGTMYDEPTWADAESAFITCISDEESAEDPDAGIRALHREYHGMSPEEGWTWPPRPAP